MTEADATTPIAGKRFIRNALLSLTGGALLTLAGASVATAQTVGDQGANIGNEGTSTASSGTNGGTGNDSGSTAAATQGDGGTNGDAAANNSGGTSNITTGDANSVGNQATNQTTQITVTGSNGVVQIIDQSVVTTNTGSANSNTGGNTGTGNNSTNNATLNQTGTGGLAVNNGTAANDSTGTSNIGTGNASAVGNSANNIVHQTANGNAVGTLGGVLIIRQDGTVSNSGSATANTGNNTGNTGNSSGNTSTVGQTSDGGPDGLANNSGTASNNSGGTANTTTGDATAIGNQATTNVIQEATGTAGGALGGIILIDQNAGVTNSGSATANTGNNSATGNDSNNDATTTQDADDDGTGDDPAVASNDGIAGNSSGGSAGIHTGAATAIGNDSTTNIKQTANATLIGGGVILGNQAAEVFNSGTADANTGFNNATGNSSDNDASVDQTADATGAGGPAVAANFGASTNWSDGTAGIWTGPATATGNHATTNIGQTFNATGGDVTIVDQGASVTNQGISEGPGAVANTGNNGATGNASDNEARSDQEATVDGAIGIAAPENFGESHNVSDGIAEIHTGAATATGNHSTTNIAQGVNAADGGLLIADQGATVRNFGTAEANSGDNGAAGNASDNEALRFQDADVDTDLDGDPAVAANFGAATNTSGGWAGVTTGAATATGNDADETTTIVQSVNGTGVDMAILGQTAYVLNSGSAYANTGDNYAVGNESDNFALVTQDSDPGEGTADSVVSSNDALGSNDSNGFAAVTTGAATATGNAATTGITQEIDLSSTGDGFVISDQSAVTINTGNAGADSGHNGAVGNTSDNEAIVDQDADGAKDVDGGDVVVTNDANAANSSNGTAWVTTGAATATGSTATSDTTQSVTSALTGDGFVLADQYAYTGNYGRAYANTGDNFAGGNGSDNEVEIDQDAAAAKDSVDGDDIVISNNADVTNASGGFGAVTTGAATATGNDADQTSTTSQAINSGIAGDGFVIGDQVAITENYGYAYANTGNNFGGGNGSDNEVEIDQDAQATKDGDVDGEDIAVTNNADVNTWSDGIGAVSTGAATATGSAATNHTTQELNGGIAGDGFIIGDQASYTYNFGYGYAYTGDNYAVGNASDNEDIDVDQEAAASDDDGNVTGDDIVVRNDADVSVASGGFAAITTGAATATGNWSDSDTTQLINGGIAGDGFVIADQYSVTVNVGAYYNEETNTAYPGAVAGTGNNVAYGNTSENDDLSVDQDAQATEDGDVTADGDIAINNDADVAIDSNGTAWVTSGAARATGNQSTSDTTQVVNGGIDGDGFVIADQGSVTFNGGYAFAYSGDNYAVGNDSDNDDVEIDQDAQATKDGDVSGDDIVVNNNADLGITSNGLAAITTGDATAIGNDSDETSTTTQVVNGGVGGDGFVIADQFSYTGNIGYGYAYTGDNDAIGNDSDNDIDLDQDAAAALDGGDVDATGEVAVNNTADVNFSSNGTAGITTGDACAYGNEATSDTTQAVNGGIGGDGFVISDQYSDTYNRGTANAYTGDNYAVGNNSDNDEIEVDQEAYGTDGGDLTAGEEVVVNNTANANIASGGSASISTGEAAAAGNKSTSSTDQSVATSIGGDGFVIADQDSYTANYGYSYANTGDNDAYGNDSDNDDVEVDQEGAAAQGGDLTTTEEAVVNNTANANLQSDGWASITTGNACACGNEADNSTSQSVNGNIGGDGFVIADQYSDTYNIGRAYANTGDNYAVGNNSDNDLDVFQDAIGATGTLTADSVVANNTADATNASNGTATIHTGNAAAQAIDADNSVAQSVTANIDGSGQVITDQDAYIANVGGYFDGEFYVGGAYANTGNNDAYGNDSDNDLEVDQDATAGTGPFESAVVNNTGDGANQSDGTATIVTGNASALGVRAVNQGSQSVNVGGDDTGLLLSDQDLVIYNYGYGYANTGDNDAYGNQSDNTAEVDQTADAVPADPTTPVIANNTADASNVSAGTASITSGNAAAGGNAVTNVGVQQIVGTFDGGIQLPSQSLTFTNIGNAEALTGDNDATGNDSTNNVTVTQAAAGEVAVNNGSANNSSTGTVNIDTGDAVACGNQATNIGVQSFGAAAPAVAAPEPVSCVPDPPDCGCDDDEPGVPGTTPPEEHGHPGTKAGEPGGGGALARTGSDISEEALFGLFLLMAGAATKRKAKRVAKRK